MFCLPTAVGTLGRKAEGGGKEDTVKEGGKVKSKGG